MQSIVSIGGKSVLVGLNWSVLGSPAVRKKEIKKVCSETGCKFGLVISGSDVGAIGVTPKKLDVPSAAAMLAIANQSASKNKKFGESGVSWIMVEKVQSEDRRDLYWLCAITDGVPVPGTDVVEELTVISAKLAELIEILEDVEIFSPDTEVQEYVATGNFTAHPQSLVEVVGSISSSKSVKIQKLDGLPEYMTAVVIVVVLLAGAGVGWSFYSEYKAKEVAKMKLLAKKAFDERSAKEAAEKNSEAYKKSVLAAKEAVLKKMMTDLSYNPAAIVDSWYKTLEGLPLNHGGWDLTSATCDLESCLITLDRNKLLGTNATLLEHIPDAEIVQADKATYKLNLVLNTNSMRNVDLNILREYKAFQISGFTTFQELKALGTDANFAAVKELTYQPPPLPSVKPGDKPTIVKPETLGFAKGALGIGRQGLWALAGLPEVLHLPEMALEKLEVQFPKNLSGESSWRLSGSYYVSSKQGLPSTGNVSKPAGLPAPKK